MSTVTDPDTWRRLAALLDEGLELAPAERPAFLERVCGQDQALRGELEALLVADERAGEFLSGNIDRYLPKLDGDDRAVEEEASRPPGDRVGPYHLLEELGAGGMGAVYLAERADGQFRQRVALKIIRRGLESGETQRRFLRERQILATLEHPNIARLLDGGLTDGGLPYFAMELVTGEPITDYCDARRLGVEERLRLFGAVCAAVQHAHRNLIVHRDLKPSNILVTPEGLVKLLDFGIAKLLVAEDSESLTLTRAVVRPLTPQYAAPEVVRGESITTSADVYSLGVLLYELLTGHRPRRHPLASGEVFPERPSLVVGRAVEARRPGGEAVSAAEIAHRRGGSVTQLSRRLRGDLDLITLQALREAPERRYPSVEALAEDVRRHLEKQPIAAKRDSMPYRASRFLRRHRLGVLAAGVVVLALVAGLTVALWQADRAAREAARAATVQKFLTSLFEASDPDEQRGETVTARALLDRGAVRIETELQNDTVLQADLLETIGTLYRKLGLYDQGQPLLERSLALRQRLFGERHLETAKSLAALGELHAEKEECAAAEPLLRQALEIRQARSRDDRETIGVLDALGSCARIRGEYAAAEPYYLEVLERQRRRWGETHPEVASALHGLAVLRFEQGKYEEAETLYRQALAQHRAAHGEDHTEVATGLYNLGLVLGARGREAEAEESFRQSLAIRRRILGDRHQWVGRTLTALGSVLQRRQELDEAERLHHEALDIFRSAVGDESQLVANALNSLAVVRYLRGDYEGSEEAFREALGVWQRVSGANHPLVLQVAVNLGGVLRDLGRYDEAEGLLREVSEKLAVKLGEEHDETARARSTLGGVLRFQGDLATAEAIHRQTLEVRRAALGTPHQQVAEALYQLGVDLELAGRYDEAEPLLIEAIEMRGQALGAEDVRRTDYLIAFAELRLDQGRFAEAEERAREAVSVRRKKVGDGDWRTGEALVVWGLGLQRLGKCGEGAEAVRQGRELLAGDNAPRPIRARLAGQPEACAAAGG